MKASGVAVDAETLKIFFQTIEGKSVPELVAAGSKKQISMPRGGGGAAAAGGAAVVEAAPVEEEKKEEVEDVDMGGLFGDDDDY